MGVHHRRMTDRLANLRKDHPGALRDGRLFAQDMPLA
jgi:hypothetical protein